MIFLIVTALIILLISCALARFLGSIRYPSDSIDDTCERKQRHFVMLASVILSAGGLLGLPIMKVWKDEWDIRQMLHQEPMMNVMREVSPALFEHLIDQIYQQKLVGAPLEAMIYRATQDLRETWMRLVPSASNEALVRYVRYRYDEVSRLALINNQLCTRLDFDGARRINEEVIDFMRDNQEYSEETMQIAFDTADPLRQQDSLEKRQAELLFEHLTEQLNTALNQQSSMLSAPMPNCTYQKAFYLSLLELQDTEISKIMRWMLSRQILAYDREQGMNTGTSPLRLN